MSNSSDLRSAAGAAQPTRRGVSVLLAGAALCTPSAAQFVEIDGVDAPAGPGTLSSFHPAVAVTGHRAALGGTVCPDDGGPCSEAVFFQARLANGSWASAQVLVSPAYDARGVGIDGDWAVAGGELGSTVFFQRSFGTWSEAQQVTPSAPVHDSHVGSGNFAAIDGAYAARGAARTATAGRVHLFERTNDSWGEVAELLASDGHVADLFGANVSISGDVALVGAKHYSVLGDTHGSAPGAAYVFERQSGGAWVEVQKLEAGPPWLEFGRAVSVSGTTAVVGATSPSPPSVGAAFVFERQPDGAWVQVQRLQSIANTNDYAASVGVSSNRIAVGAADDDKAGPGHGAIYLYEFSGSAWEKLSTLTSTTGTEGAALGAALSLDAQALFTIERGTGRAAVFEAPVLSYGCGPGPAGSLTVLGGSTALGGTLTVGVDNPLGTQAPGSVPILFASLSALPTYPCGIELPGLGMASAQAPGELLVGLAPGHLAATLIGPLWAGAGQPAPIGVPIPAHTGLLGVPVFLQGALADPSLANGVGSALTGALELRFQ